MKKLKFSNDLSVGELLDLIYKTDLDKDKVISFKNKETEEIYNLAYHYVESEIIYLYVYKDSLEKTVKDLYDFIVAESNDECWNEKDERYLEELAETEYSEDDYRFSNERIENGDLDKERLEIVKSLGIYIVFDDKEDISKVDELLAKESNIVSFREFHSDRYSQTILF